MKTSFQVPRSTPQMRHMLPLPLPPPPRPAPRARARVSQPSFRECESRPRVQTAKTASHHQGEPRNHLEHMYSCLPLLPPPNPAVSSFPLRSHCRPSRAALGDLRGGQSQGKLKKKKGLRTKSFLRSYSGVSGPSRPPMPDDLSRATHRSRLPKSKLPPWLPAGESSRGGARGERGPL